MAWRSLIESIFRVSLTKLTDCVEKKNVEECSIVLISSADAIYSPLRPVDSGLGEVKRLASRLSSLLANSFLLLAAGDEELIRRVYEYLKDRLSTLRKPGGLTSIILDEASAPIEPSWAPEPREAIVEVLREYIEPKQSTIPRRRRVLRKTDPARDLKMGLRELGRIDPLLARSIQNILSEKGIIISRRS